MMEPKQFQHLASRLSEHGAYPVEFRTAINRAYYAVFHFGLNLLREMGFSIPQNQYAHEDVCRHFNNSGNTNLINAASKIKDLYTKRIHADYYLNRADVEEKKNAKMFVQLAGRIIETLDQCCNGNDRIQIIRAIQDWKRHIKS